MKLNMAISILFGTAMVGSFVYSIIGNAKDGKRIFYYEWKKIAIDPTLYALLFSNIFVIFNAVRGNIDFYNIFLIFLSQNMLLGLMTSWRILFNPETIFLPPEVPVLPKRFMARAYGAFKQLLFFAIFNGIYFLFARTFFKPSPIDYQLFATSVGMFAASHLFSYYYELHRSKRIRASGSLVVQPILRIILLHIAIVIAGGVGGVFVSYLLLLKTAMDSFFNALEQGYIHRKFACVYNEQTMEESSR